MSAPRSPECHRQRCHNPVLLPPVPGPCFDHALEVADRELARWTAYREWVLALKPIDRLDLNVDERKVA